MKAIKWRGEFERFVVSDIKLKIKWLCWFQVKVLRDGLSESRSNLFIIWLCWPGVVSHDVVDGGLRESYSR